MQAAIPLLIVNAVFVIAITLPLAKLLSHSGPNSKSVIPWVLALLGVYMAECVAFSASMGTNALGLCLAAVWGFGFGRKLRTRPHAEAIKASLWVSLYTSLPAISFASILGLLALQGWAVLTVEGGRRFGIPSFVPWPMCTLLGFFLTVVISAVLLKTAITTGIVTILSRRAHHQRGKP